MAAMDERAAAGVAKVTQQSLAWLACPVCRGGLEVTEAGERAIRCVGCARHFRIVDGLPVLLP